LEGTKYREKAGKELERKDCGRKKEIGNCLTINLFKDTNDGRKNANLSLIYLRIIIIIR
jgi:hypothetical protein